MPASEPHSAGRRQRRRRASLLRLQPRRRQRVHRSASLRNTTGNPPRREQPGVPACSQAPSPSHRRRQWASFNSYWRATQQGQAGHRGSPWSRVARVAPVKNLFGSNVEATAAAVGDASSAAERPQSSDDRKVPPLQPIQSSRVATLTCARNSVSEECDV